MQLRIHAVEGRLVALVGVNGAARGGRFAGRAPDGTPLDEGEIVADSDHYRRAGRRGDLVVEEVAS